MNNYEDLKEINDFEQLGKILKRYREKADITLGQVQKETKIRMKYLSGIEEGKFSEIPGGDVYVKGFLKNYCKSIGIESDEILSLYKKIKGEEKKAVETIDSVENKQSKTGFNLRRNNFEHFKIRRYITIIAIFILLIALIFFKLNSKPDGSGTNLSPTTSEDNNEQPAVEEENKKQDERYDTVIQQEKQQSVNLIEDNKNSTVYEVHGSNIEVELKVISDRCWISVKRDEIADYEGILNQGESKALKAEKILSIRVGNPQVVTIISNDVDLGVMGGQARNIIFKRKN